MILNARKRIARNFLVLIHIISGPSKNKAISLTVGFYLAVFPVIGTTTLLCILTGLAFRLNHFILQSLNILLAPLQLLLVYPFLKTGRILFFQDKTVFPDTILPADWFFSGNWDNLYYLCESLIGGIVIWMIFSVSTGFFLYKLFGNFLMLSNDEK